MGVDLQAWFKKAVSSTEELDYDPALDWFGLRFAPGEGATTFAWPPEHLGIVRRQAIDLILGRC
jgi:hypothetical protein